MREIKFRVWDDVEKEYIAPAEKFCFDDIQEIIDFECDGIEFRKNKRYIFEQYTGMKDCDGTEIYEGDILFESFGGKYYKVVFENGSFRAEFEGDFEEYSFDLIDVVAQGCEVVGNIYENPELMKDK